MADNLHPSVKDFKAFLQKHPHVIKQVRSGNANLQELYEKYVLLGEDDPFWDNYQTAETDAEQDEKLHQKLAKYLENVDLNQVESHIHDLNGAIDNMITLIDQFKQYKQSARSNGQSFNHLFTNRSSD
ncbi:hypothetical protein J416_01389 [Gracilibacillus halophilus YIM-C55.5]|uniref:Coat protein n=1 Tax=Gracilibacillus halophilus YIM-C55.5 TaxID=1308866 RepID=N4WZ86_9BACI|nr:spore coat protein YlbD [Gracilibacillus halophilus]ENH98351.1 hypothetical protein J416_01389 [Gracilibacillus halophilus YIM-C55.5]